MIWLLGTHLTRRTFTLDGMFKQGFAKIASELTLNHLKNYNYHQEWKVPVAPEAYRRNLDLFGDQFSNFNAGKILLFIRRLGRSFIFRT